MSVVRAAFTLIVSFSHDLYTCIYMGHMWIVDNHELYRLIAFDIYIRDKFYPKILKFHK